MNFKKNFKKAGVGLLVSAVAIGGAFAWLTNSDVATKHNDIKVGSLVVVFDNQVSKITLADNDAIPMTAKYAVENLTPYTFTIDNTGSMGATVKLKAVDDGSTIDPTLIEIAINPFVQVRRQTIEQVSGEYNTLEEANAAVESLNATDDDSDPATFYVRNDSMVPVNGKYGILKVRETVEYNNATQWVKLSDGVIIEDLDFYKGESKEFTLYARIIELAANGDVLGKSASFHLELEAIQNNAALEADYFADSTGDVITKTEYLDSNVRDQAEYKAYEGDIYQYELENAATYLKTAGDLTYTRYGYDTNGDDATDSYYATFDTLSIGGNMPFGPASWKVTEVVAQTNGVKIN